MAKRLFGFLLFVGLTACAGLGYGQDSTSVQHSRHQIIEPLYVLNSTVIMGSGFFARMNSHEILRIVIYKGEGIPRALIGLTSGHIVSTDYKKRVPSQSFAQIARQQSVQRPFRVVINGRPLSAEQVSDLRIALGAIGQVCVTPATLEAPEAVIALELAKAKSVKHPPGSIFIR
ncbi:hypothetical protein ACFPAF_05365 [Hymenobacter endophyticus]|uniref:Uncharacterized protein n=1 Tax=Hymenobacter endophyticus TaxID=3076335 RepID=A0ABU3TEP9_9BACT|nr:hypothetical protein [Hymenobacter endophyticus]MDU0369815.1 hypothetical protein [Hymenobacter endophyticus]